VSFVVTFLPHLPVKLMAYFHLVFARILWHKRTTGYSNLHHAATSRAADYQCSAGVGEWP